MLQVKASDVVVVVVVVAVVVDTFMLLSIPTTRIQGKVGFVMVHVPMY